MFTVWHSFVWSRIMLVLCGVIRLLCCRHQFSSYMTNCLFARTGLLCSVCVEHLMCNVPMCNSSVNITYRLYKNMAVNCECNTLIRSRFRISFYNFCGSVHCSLHAHGQAKYVWNKKCKKCATIQTCLQSSWMLSMTKSERIGGKKRRTKQNQKHTHIVHIYILKHRQSAPKRLYQNGDFFIFILSYSIKILVSLRQSRI